MKAASLNAHPIHLGTGASAIIQPEFTGDMAWYEAYSARHARDGAEGRLVNIHTFSEPWSMWEMHPHGDEVVLCLSGELTLVQAQQDGSTESICLTPGSYAINKPGIWHTADTDRETTALFITAGIGTEHKPR
ncbi:MAG: hypothetical protein RIC36_08260 [Rhodospirillales bacterium]